MKRVLRDLPLAGPRRTLRAAMTPQDHPLGHAHGVAGAITAHSGMLRPPTPRPPPSPADSSTHAPSAPADWATEPYPGAGPVQVAPQGTDPLNEAFDLARRQGHEEGLQAGLQAAAQEAERRLGAYAVRLEALLQSASLATGRLEQAQEDLGIEFAYALACRVLGEGFVTRDAVRNQARFLARELGAQAPLTLRVHVQDLPLWRELIQQGPWRASSAPQVVADTSVELGGCLAETRSGTLDARLETQLELLRHAVLTFRQGQQAQDTSPPRGQT